MESNLAEPALAISHGRLETGVSFRTSPAEMQLGSAQAVIRREETATQVPDGKETSVVLLWTRLLEPALTHQFDQEVALLMKLSERKETSPIRLSTKLRTKLLGPAMTHRFDLEEALLMVLPERKETSSVWLLTKPLGPAVTHRFGQEAPAVCHEAMPPWAPDSLLLPPQASETRVAEASGMQLPLEMWHEQLPASQPGS